MAKCDPDSLEAVRARLRHLAAGTGPYDGTRLEWDFGQLKSPAPEKPKPKTKSKIPKGRKDRLIFRVESPAGIRSLLLMLEAVGRGQCPRINPDLARVTMRLRKFARRHGI